MKAYYDYKLIEQFPNKYNLTIKNIKKLKILDWDRLKKLTWHNKAMSKSGSWWCHLEGCNPKGTKYDDFNEFWIGFREEDNKVDCHFSAYEGMCSYNFDKFYEGTENKCDLQVQVNAIRFLNQLIDDEILGC